MRAWVPGSQPALLHNPHDKVTSIKAICLHKKDVVNELGNLAVLPIVHIYIKSWVEMAKLGEGGTEWGSGAKRKIAISP